MAKKTNNINTDIFCALKVAEKSKVPVLFISNPGVGKTTSVYYFAKVRGYKVILLRGNSTTAEEVMGYDVAPREVSYEHKMSAINLRPSWFEELLRYHEAGYKTLLFLDEITTANEFVQAALLHLIFERKVHTENLPDDTLIVSAGNYAQNLSNTMSLLPPVMNRFSIFNIIPDHTDLDTFLNKYEGSIKSPTGERNDYSKELEKMMKDLDKQELEIEDSKINKIGEYIERGIKETARQLMLSGEKPVDLSVVDLQNIYTDTSDGDPKLYGFVSFRTLNYLRDVTLAYYTCFGKAGISSNNYRNSIDGLCGCGVSREKSKNGDVKLNKTIGKEFFDTMNSIVNDIEKMNNGKLPGYTNFFTNATENKKSFANSDLQAIINKLDELKADKDLEKIERPIDKELIIKLCDIAKTTGETISSDKLKTDEKKVKIPTETFIGYVVTWNLVATLLSNIIDLTSDTSKGYESDTKINVTDICDNLRNVSFKLRGLKKIMVGSDPGLADILPEIKSIKK